MSADPMTQAQRDSICKAWNTLTEHFDAVLLVVDWETQDDACKLADMHEGFWHGGALVAVGLAEFAKSRVMSSGEKVNEPEL